MEDQLHTANRMAALANMVGQGGIPPGLGSDPTAAANITAANLANLAMRLGVTQVKIMTTGKINIMFSGSVFFETTLFSKLSQLS